MAKPIIGVTSDVLIQATFALQSSITLFETITSFKSDQERVRNLLEELGALSDVLRSLTDTIHASTDEDFAPLILPLQRCGGSCKDFQDEISKCAARSSGGRTSFRDWDRLRFTGEDIDGFRRLLAGYKATICIAVTAANLRKSAWAAHSIEPYNELISTAREDLEVRLQSIDEKLEVILGRSTAVSESDASEVQLIKEGPLSTEKPLQICVELLEHISQIQLAASRKTSGSDDGDSDTIPENITNKTLHEVKESLTLTIQTLKEHEKQLFNQLIDKSKTVVTSEEERVDFAFKIHEHSEEAYSDNESVAASVFTEGTSTSSVTSVGSNADIVSEVASALFCNEELMPINAGGIQDDRIGPNMFQRHVRALIVNFGKNLIAECRGPVERGAARSLYSRRISSLAARQIVEHVDLGDNNGVNTWPRPANFNMISKLSRQQQRQNMEENFVDNQSEASTDSSEDEEDMPEDHTEGLRTVKDFLIASQAYTTFRVQLLDFVHAPYQRRVINALGNELLSESGTRLRESSVHALGQEISWVPPTLFEISYNEPLTLVELLQAWIEDASRESWYWWPLPPRKYALRSGYCRLKWFSPCGAPRYIDAPGKVARAVQGAMRSAPAFLESFKPSIRARQSSPGPPSVSTSHTNSGPPPSTPRTTGQIPEGAQQAQPQQQMPGSSTTYLQNVLSPRRNPKDVWLCIKLGSAYRLWTGRTYNFSPICCEGLQDDRQFFSALRDEYLTVRGRLWLYLGWWRYDYCEFYRFWKFDTDMAGPQSLGFPPHNEPRYEFDPSPIKPEPPDGPISKDEFNHHFYGHCNPCHLWRNWYRRDRTRRLNGQPRNTALASLPKRTEELEMGDGIRETFWGIYAKERRALAITMFYTALLTMPSVIFFAFWLSKWGHPADLQNASVPLTICHDIAGVGLGLGWRTDAHDHTS